MSFEFLCERCGAKLRIEDDLAGKTVKCPNCSAVVPAKPAEEPAAASPFAASGASADAAGEVNPYASPATVPEGDFGVQTPGGTLVISPGVHRALGQTRPWVVFLSILGFICGGFMALGAVGVLIGAAVSGEPAMLFLGPFYLIYAALYLAGSYYLLVYGLKIGSLQRTNSLGDLEAALVAQKSFWKLLGIVTAIGLVLGVLAIAGFMVFGVMASRYM
ncbi:MAG: hypothetical protein HQ582_29760 [Planctomycetes bacterium]|nr:hypothetical protein [Planctomycetota bacterium]